MNNFNLNDIEYVLNYYKIQFSKEIIMIISIKYEDIILYISGFPMTLIGSDGTCINSNRMVKDTTLLNELAFNFKQILKP